MSVETYANWMFAVGATFIMVLVIVMMALAVRQMWRNQ